MGISLDKEILKIKNKLLTKYKNTLSKVVLKNKQLKIERNKLDKLLKEAKHVAKNNIFLKQCAPFYVLDEAHEDFIYEIEDEEYTISYINNLKLIIKTLKTTKDENVINALSVANQLNIEINDFCYHKNSHKAFKYFPINYKIYKNSHEQYGYFYSHISAGLTIKYDACCFDGLYYLLNDNGSKQIFKMMPKYKQKALMLKLLKTNQDNLKSCMKHLSYDKDLANIVAKYMVFSND